MHQQRHYQEGDKTDERNIFVLRQTKIIKVVDGRKLIFAGVDLWLSISPKNTKKQRSCLIPAALDPASKVTSQPGPVTPLESSLIRCVWHHLDGRDVCRNRHIAFWCTCSCYVALLLIAWQKPLGINTAFTRWIPISCVTKNHAGKTQGRKKGNVKFQPHIRYHNHSQMEREGVQYSR